MLSKTESLEKKQIQISITDIEVGCSRENWSSVELDKFGIRKLPQELNYV